jgi:hypothetical protein
MQLKFVTHFYFGIGATFEMRTALCEIRLLNDKQIMHDSVLYQNKICGERAAWRDQKRESVRDSVGGNENSVSNKIDHWQKIFMADVGD